MNYLRVILGLKRWLGKPTVAYDCDGNLCADWLDQDGLAIAGIDFLKSKPKASFCVINKSNILASGVFNPTDNIQSDWVVGYVGRLAQPFMKE